jgi:hypothetical protein
MLSLLPERPDLPQAPRWDEQSRPRISHPERPEALELPGQVHPDAFPTHPDQGVEPLQPHEVGRIDPRLCLCDERLAELLHMCGLQLQAGGRAVPAVAEQMLAAGAKRLDQVKARDAPGGALRALPIDRQQNRWTEVALDHPGRRDAHDAGMPPSPGQDECRRLALSGGQCRPRALGVLDDLLLGPAALGVGPVELGCDGRRSLRIAGQHQLDARVGPVEAAGGVDSRPQPEPESGRVDGVSVDGRRGHQGAEPDPGSVPHQLQALPDEPSVLAHQRDHVGDRGEGDQIQVAVAGVTAPPDRLHRPAARRV